MIKFKAYITEAASLSTKEGVIADGIDRLIKAYRKHGDWGSYQYSGRAWASIDKIEDGIIARFVKLGISHKDAFDIVFGTIRSAATKAHHAYQEAEMAKWEAADAKNKRNAN